MNDRYVLKRVVNIFLMLLITLLFTFGISMLKGRLMDEVLVYSVMELAFFAVFAFLLEHERVNRRIADNRETTFRRLSQGYLISWIFILFSAFLPEFLRPVVLVPILMLAYATPQIALFVGLFLSTMLCLMAGSTMQELALCSVMALLGCIAAEAAERARLHFWYELAVFCICAIFPGLFYYLTYRETSWVLPLVGAVEGLLAALLLHFCYDRLALARRSEISDTLTDILDDAYPLSRELFGFSKADYQHAKRVSRAAARCAALVGANEAVCAAAGFYYRIGILEGSSIAKNGVLLAQRECFPEDLIRIISEYNGEDALPSTIESAIVHMADAVIKKLEVFDSDTMSSEWNQDMVIYQTLNDYSAQGLYDKSGLSMNMFLRIREYLVNEKSLVK